MSARGIVTIVAVLLIGIAAAFAGRRLVGSEAVGAGVVVAVGAVVARQWRARTSQAKDVA